VTPDDMECLLAAATPGPWESHTTICCPDRGSVSVQETGHAQPSHAFSITDAELVVALRNAAPALLRLWRAANALRDGDTPAKWGEFQDALRELEAVK